METLESIRRRIESADDLRSIVRTMKTMAAVGIRQYERAASALADYDRTVRLGLQAALRETPTGREAGAESGRTPLGERSVIGVVFGSDQGMCGQLNDRVAERASRALGRATEPPEMIVVGERVASLLAGAGHRIAERFGTPSSISGVGPGVRSLWLALDGLREARPDSGVYLVFPRRTSPASYEPRTRRILPMDERWLRTLRDQAWPTRCLPSWPVDRRTLLSALVREYLFVSLFRAQVDALASEHASRLASMQSAERNIDERLGELRTEYRRQRQTAITSELMDVVSGFEALSEEDGRGRRFA